MSTDAENTRTVHRLEWRRQGDDNWSSGPWSYSRARAALDRPYIVKYPGEADPEFRFRAAELRVLDTEPTSADELTALADAALDLGSPRL